MTRYHVKVTLERKTPLSSIDLLKLSEAGCKGDTYYRKDGKCWIVFERMALNSIEAMLECAQDIRCAGLQMAQVETLNGHS